MTCSIDDSIYFQAKIGREKECEAALQRLRGENADISQEAAEIRVTSSLHTSMRE
jgi:SP family sugar porter-like MFS transporter